MSTGTPIGSWNSGAGVPCTVRPWLYRTFTLAGRPPVLRAANWIAVSNAVRSISSM
jgi:hypothetical protein